MNKIFGSGVIVALFTLASSLFCSCQEYLDVVPDNDITTIETTFEKKEDAYKWLKTCFSMTLLPTSDFRYNPAYWGTDEVVVDDYTRMNGLGSYYNHEYISGVMIADGNQMAQNPYANTWSGEDNFYIGLRYCNVFLEHIDHVYNMQEDEKYMWKGQIMAVKAHIYFELMRRYGPFILVPENIDAAAEIEDMIQPRACIDSCVEATVALLDEAIKRLPYQYQLDYTFYDYFNKEGAAALKAMVLLYAASPLFNGSDMHRNFTNIKGEKLFPEYDREKWHRAAIAADEAIAIAEAAGKHLVKGSSDRPTTMLNVIRDLEKASYNYSFNNTESLLCFRDQGYDPALLYHPYIGSEFSNYYDYYLDGGFSASMASVEAYYTEHGLPLSEDKQWMSSRYALTQETDDNYKNVVPLNQDVISLHRRREPRFYANIVSHGTYWYRKKYGGQMEALYCDCLQGHIMGSQSKTYDSSIPQGLSGYYIKKFDRTDTALRGYYMSNQEECANMVFRLPDILLASAEAWNEYLDKPDNRVYDPLNQIRERAGIPTIQDAWQTYARNPQKATSQAGMREIIMQEWTNEFMFEGRRFWNLRRWMTASDYLNAPQYGWNVLSSDEKRFFNNGNGPIPVWKKRNFTAPRDYFMPIASEQVLVSGIVQNPGW